MAAQAVTAADIMQQQMPGMAMQQLGMDPNAAIYTSNQFTGGDPRAYFTATLAVLQRDHRPEAVIACISV